MKKTYSTVICVVMIAVLLAGCVQNPAPSPTATAPSPAAQMTYRQALEQLAQEQEYALTEDELSRIREESEADAATLINAGEEGENIAGELFEEYVISKLESRLRDALAGDITATDAEVQSWFDTRFEALKTAFEKDPGAYKNQQDSYDMFGGVPPLIIPEGYIRVKHILVTDSALAQDIYTKLLNGSAFDELLDEYGEDEGQAIEPYASKGYLLSEHLATRDFLPEFKTAALALQEVGEFSGIVKSDAGFHIIKLLEKIENRDVPLSEVEDEIRTILTNTKRQKALEEIVKTRMVS